VQQPNLTTAVVDATSGGTYTWDGAGRRWQKSTTRVSGDTALHLTSDNAITVDRASGTVRQLEPGLVSDPVGKPVQLASRVSESVVDGGDALWLALPATRPVVAVDRSGAGPSVRQEFRLWVNAADGRQAFSATGPAAGRRS
jgi:hypothetical protein